MGKLKNFVNKITGADRTTAQVYEDNMAKRQKVFDKILKEKSALQKMQGECAAVLDACAETFATCINVERARAKHKSEDGFDTSTEHSRIREAAVGILIAREAKYKLDAITSESDLNMAMNRLGMALRQLHRMDNSSVAVSAFNEKILEQWCPGVVSEVSDLTSTKLEVPAEMRAQINDNFVSFLVDGYNYDYAKKMAAYTSPAPEKKVEKPQPVAQPVVQTSSVSTDTVNELLARAYGASGTKEEPEDLSRFTKEI